MVHPVLQSIASLNFTFNQSRNIPHESIITAVNTVVSCTMRMNRAGILPKGRSCYTTTRRGGRWPMDIDFELYRHEVLVADNPPVRLSVIDVTPERPLNTIVMLHGFGGNAKQWKYQLRALAP